MAGSFELKDELGQETGENPTPKLPMIAEPEQPIGVTIIGFGSLGSKGYSGIQCAGGTSYLRG